MNRSILIIWILIVSFFLTISCNEDPSQIGISILPEDDFFNVNVIDTLTVDAYTVGPVGIPSTNRYNFPFGCINDSIFGSLSVDFMIQISPEGYKNIGTLLSIDSVFLEIEFDSYDGDSSYIPQLEVYKLKKPIDDTLKYSNLDPSDYYYPENLAISNTIQKDSLLKYYIRLNPLLGSELLYNDSTFFINDSIFSAKFPGFYIKSPREVNNIGSIKYGKKLKLTVYYTNTSGNSSYTFSFYPDYDIFFNPYPDYKVSICNFDYSKGKISSLNNPSIKDSLLYIQSMGGTQVIFTIPGLPSLKEKLGNKIIINKAELILPMLLDSSDYSIIKLTNQLGIRVLNEDNTQKTLPEDFLNSLNTRSYIDGIYNPTTKSYRIIMTGYMQNYFRGTENSNKFQIFSALLNTSAKRTDYNIFNLNRTVVANQNHPNRKLQFKLYYTKL